MRHYREWVFTLIGFACLMKWLFSEDLDALVVASMCFILAKLEGMSR